MGAADTGIALFMKALVLNGTSKKPPGQSNMHLLAEEVVSGLESHTARALRENPTPPEQ